MGDIITTKTKGRSTFFARVDHLFSALAAALNPFGDPEYIVIESALNRVKRGKGSAHTIAVLHRFNGMASYGMHMRYPDANLTMLPPAEARKLAGQPKRKKSACPKEHALKWASGEVQGTSFALEGAGRYDRADALGLALASFRLSR